VPVENQKEKHMSETTKESRPLPPPMPTTSRDWALARDHKASLTLNDHVEGIHLRLWESKNEVEREKYQRYLYATYDEQAVEGSLSADNTLAAGMIREAAADHNPVKREKLATISKALGVVLRRYHESRTERRNRIGDQIITADNGRE
jgi:hypothetical protein